jgi:hypothetical protein
MPAGFQHRIATQISEQISAYTDLISSLKKYCDNPLWLERIKEPQMINVGIRHNTLGTRQFF